MSEAQYSFFRDNYSVIVAYQVLPGAHKQYVLHEVTDCRYCGTPYSPFAFRKAAHAVPEFLGNKSLFSSDECDACNAIFGDLLEDHLAKYLGASRTFSKIPGKRGIPIYRSPDKRSRVQVKDDTIVVTGSSDGRFFSLDKDKKSLRVETVRQPYLPIAVYKSLQRIGLSVMPRDELHKFARTRQWIRQSTHTIEGAGYSPLLVQETFIPGPMPVPGVRVILLKRKGSAVLPYMILVLAFANSCMQVIMYSENEDKRLLGQDLRVSFFPTSREGNLVFGDPIRKTVDMSSCALVRNEATPITFRFGSMEEL